jgi:hypothetical protein
MQELVTRNTTYVSLDVHKKEHNVAMLLPDNPIKMTCSPKSRAGFREQARISSICQSLADLGATGNQYLPELFQRL